MRQMVWLAVVVVILLWLVDLFLVAELIDRVVGVVRDSGIIP